MGARALALLLCLALAGCAAPRAQRPDKGPEPGEVASVQKAREAIVIGQSTKAEVAAALGKPIAMAFDSGYETWVYREQLPEKRTSRPQRVPETVRNADRAELVLLFGPSGVVTKLRVRSPGAAS